MQLREAGSAADTSRSHLWDLATLTSKISDLHEFPEFISVALAKPPCNSEERILPLAPYRDLQMPSWRRLWSKIFFLTDKSKRWSCAGLLLWVCLTCKSNQRCTGFRHLLWIKLFHADKPPDFDFYCYWFSGFRVRLCLLVVSALHSIWLLKRGVSTKATLEDKIKKILCGQLRRKNLQRSDMKSIPWDLTPLIG